LAISPETSRDGICLYYAVSMGVIHFALFQAVS
jgi:hypothetical protein